MKDIEIKSLFDIEKTIAKDIFYEKTYPWEVLGDIEGFIKELGEKLPKEEYEQLYENVWASKSAKVYNTVCFDGACIIDHNAIIKHCAYIRGNAIIGKNCVVGNSVELKNVILFDNVQVPHYNYVGDSILGYKSHMGAGSITSNVKSDKSLVVIKNGKESIETNRKKVGAFVGDYAEIGCNSVLCPGCIVGRNSTIYPLSKVRGVVSYNMIYKNEKNIVEKLRMEE